MGLWCVKIWYTNIDREGFSCCFNVIQGSEFRVGALFLGLRVRNRLRRDLCTLIKKTLLLMVRMAPSAQLDRLFLLYDDDGNGNLELEEFEAMIREISEHCHLFTGAERLSSLSKTQLQALVLYDFDKVATEFDDETGLMKVDFMSAMPVCV